MLAFARYGRNGWNEVEFNAKLKRLERSIDNDSGLKTSYKSYISLQIIEMLYNAKLIITLLAFIGISFVILFPEALCYIENPDQDKSEVANTGLDRYRSFKLQSKMLLDTGDKAIAERGLSDIDNIGIDSEKNIYLLDNKSGGNAIFKFNDKGKFVTSFGRKGQGPGEIELAYELHVTKEDNIFIYDSGRRRMVLFGKNGNLINEKKIPIRINNICPLSNGHYVGEESNIGPATKEFSCSLNYYDGEFNKIKQLDMLKYPNPFQNSRIDAYLRTMRYVVSENKIYSGYPERGYKILVFSLDGELIEEVLIEQRNVLNNTRYKDMILEYIGALPKIMLDKLVFPKYLPPFHSFIVDERGYLFVMTYEEGKDKGGYIYDILSPKGVIIRKESLEIAFEGVNILAKIVGSNLYWIRQSESGDKQLFVSSMY